VRHTFYSVSCVGCDRCTLCLCHLCLVPCGAVYHVCDVPCNVRIEELLIIYSMLAVAVPCFRCTSYFPCVPYGSCMKCCTFVVHHVRGVLCVHVYQMRNRTVAVYHVWERFCAIMYHMCSVPCVRCAIAICSYVCIVPWYFKWRVPCLRCVT
jgi:hypothetical protein